MISIMYKFFICFLVLIIPEIRGQSLDDVNILINKDSTSVTVKYSGQTLSIDGLSSPKILGAELNNDDKSELIVTSKNKQSGLTTFSAYILNLYDSLYVIDSVKSGVLEPFMTYSDEISSNLLIIGYPELDSLNLANGTSYSPLNVLMYDGSKLYSANDEVYNIFIVETEELTGILDSKPIITDCQFSREHSSLIASIYINYVNAGELSLATMFLKNYYLCTDYIVFKDYLRNLLGL